MTEGRQLSVGNSAFPHSQNLSRSSSHATGVTISRYSSSSPGRISEIELASTSGYARGLCVMITSATAGEFSVDQSNILRKIFANDSPVDDDLQALKNVRQVIPDARIQFRLGNIVCGFEGAEALVSFCTATGLRALPTSLTDLTCPSTGLQLNSLKDAEQLRALAKDSSFISGAYILLADANRLAVLNHTESRGKVSQGLKEFAGKLFRLLNNIPTLVNRMGDEIILAIPAVHAESIKTELVNLFNSPIREIRQFTAEMCAIRNAVEMIETKFLSNRPARLDMASFVQHLRTELVDVQARFGKETDRNGNVSGTISRVLRYLDAWEPSLVSQTPSSDLAEAQIRVAGFIIDLLMRSQLRFGKFTGTFPFASGPTKPGAFDIAAVYLDRASLSDPAKVELAVHACCKFVGRKKRQFPGRIPLFSRSHGWGVCERTNPERRAISRFNNRVARYASLRNQLIQLRESRLLDRFALSVQVTSALFGHPFVEGVYQLRALATERPVEVVGIDPGASYQILKLELNLKPFNDLGYDLGDRVMAEISSVVKQKIPDALLFIEAGELSVLLRGPVALDDNLLDSLVLNARIAVKSLMERSLFSSRPGSGGGQAEGDSRRDNFMRRGIYSVTWKRLLRRMRGVSHGRRETDLFRVRVSNRTVYINRRATFQDLFNLE